MMAERIIRTREFRVQRSQNHKLHRTSIIRCMFLFVDDSESTNQVAGPYAVVMLANAVRGAQNGG